VESVPVSRMLVSDTPTRARSHSRSVCST